MQFTEEWKEITLPENLPKPFNKLPVRAWEGRNQTSIIMVLGTSDEVDKVLAWRKKGDEKIIETVLQMLKDTNIIYDKEKWESARNLQEIHKQLWNKYQQIDSQCIYIVSFSVCLTLFDF